MRAGALVALLAWSCSLPSRVDYGQPCDDDGACPLPYSCVEGRCLIGCAGDDACDDGVFCNGVERCEDGACAAGDAPCAAQRCSEERAACDACDDNSGEGGGFCDDGAPSSCADTCRDDDNFCNGTELCQADGACAHSGDPCAAQGLRCDGERERCVECVDDDDCPARCDRGAGACVECVDDDDCVDPLSRCDDNLCRLCVDCD